MSSRFCVSWIQSLTEIKKRHPVFWCQRWQCPGNKGHSDIQHTFHWGGVISREALTSFLWSNHTPNWCPAQNKWSCPCLKMKSTFTGQGLNYACSPWMTVPNHRLSIFLGQVFYPGRGKLQNIKDFRVFWFFWLAAHFPGVEQKSVTLL